MSWHSKPDEWSWKRYVVSKTTQFELEKRVKCMRQFESLVAANNPEELAAWKALYDNDVIE